MNEANVAGIFLTLISAVVLGIGFATGAMPINYKALDTSRDKSPAIFWGFSAFWVILSLLGIAIALRHFSE